MTKTYRTIAGSSYLYWRGYYWLAIKEFKCSGCKRKLTKYRKFRKWKGELQEVKQGYRCCPDCTISISY